MNTIKSKRVALGLTQSELATEMEVDRTTVTKWETGKAFPKAKMLPAFGCLNVSIADLLME